MATLTAASLTDTERRALERLVSALERELGDDLHAVWLYGSRARGEPVDPYESDIDLLVIAEPGALEDRRMRELVAQATKAEGVYPYTFMAHVFDPERVAQRRAIEAFFIQEVDRDKVVLAGGEVEPPADFQWHGETGPVRKRTREYLFTAHEERTMARMAIGAGLARPAISRAYYMALNAAIAVASELADRYTRTHRGLWHIAHEELVATGRLPAELHARVAELQHPRERADYGPRKPEHPFPEFTMEEARQAVADAERYLSAVEDLLGA